MVQADRAKDEVGDGLVSELRAAELRLRKEAMRRLCPFIQGVAHRPFAVLPQCSQSILSAVLPAYQMPHTVAGLDLSTHKLWDPACMAAWLAAGGSLDLQGFECRKHELVGNLVALSSTTD